MQNSLRPVLILLLMGSLAQSGFAQFFNFNAPTITGQEPKPLLTNKNTPITITFDNLKVSDPDILVPAYPQGYTLKVSSGSNYTVVNSTVTPAANFAGTLTVKVQVNDGKFDSNVFDLKIDVTNAQPVITGQDPISIKKGGSFTLLLKHLKVTDDDNQYPDDFTLKIYDGKNYNVSGNTITPDADFAGSLKVIVTVNDGIDESGKFELIIDVKQKNNPPLITNQVPLSTNEDQAITIALKNLTVEDPDNSYPDGFKLKILQGQNYSSSGSKITPSPNFYGELIVPIIVNDGLDDSNLFNLKITVNPINDPPVITGQSAITIVTGVSTQLTLQSLIVADPDNQILALRILPGANYTFSGNYVTSSTIGTIKVKVVVNDGMVDSAPFDLNVNVLPKSPKPVITGQQSLIVDEDHSITLKLSDISVTDEDDEYPVGFTMKVYSGTDYTFNGLTITPRTNFTGLLSVSITVNDGNDNSPIYLLKIYVVPVNDAPQITVLEEDLIPYEPGGGQILITELFKGEDIDNTYLSFAEVSIADTTFNSSHDVLIFENTEHIRGIYDQQKGILSLIGYATLEQYDSAIRSIKYNYLLTTDEEGNYSEILPGPKYIQFKISDGALESEKRIRTVSIESSVLLDIPNAFTPNGDKNNNTWAVHPLTTSHQFDKAIIKVYNKRGLLIYESKGFEKSWDGHFNGEQLPVDTYYYTIDLKLSYTKKTYKGTVMILR